MTDGVTGSNHRTDAEQPQPICIQAGWVKDEGSGVALAAYASEGAVHLVISGSWNGQAVDVAFDPASGEFIYCGPYLKDRPPSTLKPWS